MLTKGELIALDIRIGRNADRLIAKAQRGLYSASQKKSGKQPASFENCVLPELIEIRMNGEEWPLWVDDVLAGVARLDWYSQKEDQRPLSTKKILKLLSSLDTISTETVSHYLKVGERQARRYFNACRYAHDKLIDGYCDDEVQFTHYPETFIYPKRSI